MLNSAERFPSCPIVFIEKSKAFKVELLRPVINCYPILVPYPRTIDAMYASSPWNNKNKSKLYLALVSNRFSNFKVVGTHCS